MRESAYEFAARVDRDIEALPDELYRMPSSSPGGKKLIQEYLPLSRFALHLKVPGLQVDVETTDLGAEEDGIIHVQGFIDETVRIQIAYIYGHSEALRDEALHRYGVVAGVGSIKRVEGGGIEATMGVDDFDGPARRVAESAWARYEKKNAQYREGMYLLIAFADVHVYTASEWIKVRELIHSRGGFRRGTFKQIWLCNCTHNALRRFA